MEEVTERNTHIRNNVARSTPAAQQQTASSMQNFKISSSHFTVSHPSSFTNLSSHFTTLLKAKAKPELSVS
jgi:hypothetical protein